MEMSDSRKPLGTDQFGEFIYGATPEELAEQRRAAEEADLDGSKALARQEQRRQQQREANRANAAALHDGPEPDPSVYHPAGSCDACAQPPDKTALTIAGLLDELDQQRIRAEAAEAELEKTVDWAGANVRIVRKVRELHQPVKLNNGRGCPRCGVQGNCETYEETL